MKRIKEAMRKDYGDGLRKRLIYAGVAFIMLFGNPFYVPEREQSADLSGVSEREVVESYNDKPGEVFIKNGYRKN